MKQATGAARPCNPGCGLFFWLVPVVLCWRVIVEDLNHSRKRRREMRWWCDAGGACLLILSDHLRGLPCWVSLSGRVVARRTYWSLALDFHLLAHCTLYPAPLSEVFLPRHSLFVYSETQDRTENPAPISRYLKSLLRRAPKCPDYPAP